MAIKVTQRGQALLRDPLLNKNTAFTEEEKRGFHLCGLLPMHSETIEEQLARCHNAYSAKPTNIEKHIYLRALQDRNEVLFYRYVLENLLETMPIIYTPVVGEACQSFHRIYREPRGVFINYPERDKIDEILSTIAASRSVGVIVVTDGERILGLGDQGSGGLGIPIGKLSLYTVCGGINPALTLPVVLDVGTNNEALLEDEEYLGWRHHRLTGDQYYDFVDQFVQSVKKHFPHVLLQFEDFAQQHAYPLLKRYRDQLCTFNDDIQGTAAVALAAVLAATKVAKIPLKEQRIAVFGAGSAGCGISEQLVSAMISQGISETEARSRFYLIDRNGLLHDGMTDLLPFQKPFAQSQQRLKGWVKTAQAISLSDVVEHAKPTILLGVSGQPNQFTEPTIQAMAAYCERPIIFPLSNPTSRVEATPSDLLKWTSGKALVATGSPFENVHLHGKTHHIAQCNNSYIFPGVGLGVLAGKAKRVTDGMMMAAAMALSELAPAVRTGEGALLPNLLNIREVSEHIAHAVILQAMQEGHITTKHNEAQIKHMIQETVWFPEYQTFEK